MKRSELTPEMWERLRAQSCGAVFVCLDCDWVGIGRPASVHTLYHPGHRKVTEREFTAMEAELVGHAHD